MSVLEELYYNRMEVNPGFEKDSLYGRTLSRAIAAENRLKERVGEGELLKELTGAYAEMEELVEKGGFVRGFQLGAQLMLEILERGRA